MHILGISAYYHDSSACLVHDGRVVAAAQEERWSRIKHDPGFPRRACEYCLREAGIRIDDLEYVAFYDKPFLKFERLLETYLASAPRGLRPFLAAMPVWIKEKLWLPDIIKKELGFTKEVLFLEHHQSHAASAFFPSPFKRAAILTLDGVGEWTTTSWGVGRDNTINLKAEIRFPHSLGLLYSAFTYFLGFRVNSGEYKVMGLAPYGEPRYVDVILRELIDLKEDGSYKLNMKYFGYCQGLTMTNRFFDRLFGGPPRKPETRISQREMDMAASIQHIIEKAVMRTARHIHQTTGEKNLVLAGGTALNCVSNGKLLREGPFDRIWIQPAAGDAGGSMGAALFTWYQYLNNTRDSDNVNDKQQGSYLGPAFDEDHIESFLRRMGIQYQKVSWSEIPQKAAKILADGKIVGWFQGRMEFGPRALGNRSILADPRIPGMQSLLNRKIKYRESFRPFAPAVLCEKASDYFQDVADSPYMLLVANVKTDPGKQMVTEERMYSGMEKRQIIRSAIPAVTHIDYSARVQTVHSETNPLFHQLIRSFEDITGCGVIVNTSFNVRGEPIVCTPENAYACFMRTNMDYLVMGPFLLDKNRQPFGREDRDPRTGLEPD